MAHIRQQIRDAVTGLLDAGTGWNYVYEQRDKQNRNTYPFLIVYVDSESSDVETLNSPFQLYRDMNLVVQGFIRSQDLEYIENKLDDIAVEVETLLTTATINGSVTLSRRVVSVYLAGTDMELNYDGDDIEDAVISMGFVVRYQTEEGSPDA